MKIHIENLKVLNVLQFSSSPSRVYRNRPSHALVFRREGSISYDYENKTQLVHPGYVTLIPQGANFTVTRLSTGPSRYTVINFQGDFSLDSLMFLRPEMDMTALYTLLDQCSTLDPEAEQFMLLSHFYRILSQLFEQKPAYHSRQTFRLIAPAVACLQERLFDPELKIGSLHTLCGISDTYFRTLFAARFGTSPKKYVLDRRLNQARNLLSSGECGSVSEAARMSGFEDALYFSKVFKNRYGHAPSHTEHK